MENENYIQLIVEDVRAAQKITNKIFMEHAAKDSEQQLALQRELAEIRIHMVRIENRVNQNSNIFLRMWALLAPLIITGLTIYFYKAA